MRSAFLSLPFLVASMSFPSAGHSQDRAVWQDTPVTRLQAEALLQDLNARLLSHDSATLTLDHWCARHELAPGQKIVAERVKDMDKPAGEEVRAALKVSMDEPVGYRRVRLKCGDHVLSVADNWYVPSRLTPEMNKVLDSTDTAFGRVVQPLHFQRHTISAELLWRPLPEAWEMGAPIESESGPLHIPDEVLQHHALLSVPDGTPISMVVETYTKEVLAFPPPKLVEKKP
ncbi:hypothetical protein [Rhizobium paknamense]|uniref:Chorismate-pyruvate lyase n=1 Tax=Rhizobium paknamense TaxID=1206817 RepID=A0ABU0I917_9HYPH|nr:hypothetical protein [Rhizobium paknamense]MDQ0453729.1 chorismate-pyruvate lyase [Rhizobium paknamense]